MIYGAYTPSSDKFSDVQIGEPFEFEGQFYLKIEEIFSAGVEGDSSLPEEEQPAPSTSEPTTPASEEDDYEWDENEEDEGNADSSEDTTVLTPIANAINFSDGSSILIEQDATITLVDYELNFSKKVNSPADVVG